MKWDLKLIALLVVCAGWLLTLIASIFVAGYNPPNTVHLAMMAVLGGLFGGLLLQKGETWAKTPADSSTAPAPGLEDAKKIPPAAPKGTPVVSPTAPKPKPPEPPPAVGGGTSGRILHDDESGDV